MKYKTYTDPKLEDGKLEDEKIAPKDNSITRFTPYYYEVSVKEFLRRCLEEFENTTRTETPTQIIERLAGKSLIGQEDVFPYGTSMDDVKSLVKKEVQEE